jgi:MFS family permease
VGDLRASAAAPVRRPPLAPLYGAGFLTAVGAHGVAANLGVLSTDQGASLLTVGLLLTVYDAAEVILKPVFGALADRIGPRPVILGGVIGFAAASAAFVLLDDPAMLGAARFAQGAAAAAFSPAASAMVGRLSGPRTRGRSFGGYGAAKSAGYTLGPVAGGLLIMAGGDRLLFATLAVLGVLVAVWVRLGTPHLEPLPRSRATLADLTRRLTQPGFLRPTLALAGGAAALAVGVGFLPLAGAGAGLSPVATGTLVSLLGGCAIAVQPWAGRARDRGRLRDTPALTAGLVLAAAGVVLTAVLAAAPSAPVVLLPAAVAIGAGTALLTPIGFAHLADHTPPDRLGQTMGSAEVGRELGDAGGPLMVGVIAAASSLAVGLAALAGLLLISGGTIGFSATATPAAEKE